MWNQESHEQIFFPSFSEIVYGKDITRTQEIRIKYMFHTNKWLNNIIEPFKRNNYFKKYDYSEIFYEVIFETDAINERLMDANNDIIYSKNTEEIILGDGQELSWSGNSLQMNWTFDLEPGIHLNILRNKILHFIGRMSFLSVDRRPRNWNAQPRRYIKIGIHGENVVSLLNYLRNSNEILYNDICNAVSNISPDISQTKSPMDVDGRVSITHINKHNKVEVNTLLSGTGINQTIPIITQLKYANEGDIILIEEPELSLYSDAQDKLVDIMLEESLKGKQIIFTTHSDTIPFSLLRKIGHRDLPTDYVKCYEISKEDGKTKAVQKSLEESMGILFSPKGWTPA